jgi:hypothetical protein
MSVLASAYGASHHFIALQNLPAAWAQRTRASSKALPRQGRKSQTDESAPERALGC